MYVAYPVTTILVLGLQFGLWLSSKSQTKPIEIAQMTPTNVLWQRDGQSRAHERPTYLCFNCTTFAENDFLIIRIWQQIPITLSIQ